MTASELIIGGKYFPIDKTVIHHGHLEDCYTFKLMKEMGQEYMFYRGYDGNHAFAVDMDTNRVDYFNPSDVSTYSPEKISAIDYVLIHTPPPMKHAMRNILKKASALWLSQMMDAYNQGYRDGESDAESSSEHIRLTDISEFSNAKEYILKNYKR